MIEKFKDKTYQPQKQTDTVSQLRTLFIALLITSSDNFRKVSPAVFGPATLLNINSIVLLLRVNFLKFSKNI